ncbi:MAG: cytochrome c maturation protein CcmE [Armatimonadetes bacterium]|nr:cytochrome c maturation protein CcmE [Armatimonadota bacterium]
MKHKGAILGLVIIVAALGFSANAFKSSLINYIPFADAMKATDATVQVMGAPVEGTMIYDDAAHAMRFLLRDDQNQTLPVIYHGPKPEDMDSASAKGTKIAVQGTYDPAQHQFVADKLLVKCPSKYNGAGGQERSYGSS